ncbi:Acetamidase regulatory protein [Neonectria ditissima]|uniref:Acetamidase regulatory protein n=1 Tax=Neonectria ditissima TaxID=78410 RepID=A0A0P7BBW6_9HYPO|nr:Acetamidase regulatory protein [Neonectria ditissima]
MPAQGRRAGVPPRHEPQAASPGTGRRTIRCDILAEGPPCSNCLSQNISSCRFYEKKKARSSLARHSRSHVPIQPRGQQIVTAPATPIDVHPPWPDASVPPVPQEASTSISVEASEFVHRDQQQRRPGPRSASASISSTTYNGEGVDERASRNLAEFIDTDDVRVSEIGQNSRLYFIGTEFSNLNYLVRQRSPHVNLDQLHFGSHHPARKVGRIPAEVLELPEKALADELIQAYFAHVNSGWPIVDEVDFMARYNSSDPRHKVPLPLLYAVFLVGAHASVPRPNNYRALKMQFFHRAKLLIDSRFEEDRKLYVQVALLLTWSCDNLEDIVSNSWYWIGFAARTALGLGMHRDASQSKMSVVPKREWVRIWWVIFQFDVLLSTAYGRPQAIRLDESDTQALQECHFEGIPQANVAFVIEHTRLCVIFSKSMRQVLALRSTPAEKAEARRRADEDLAQFIIQLPECLRKPQSEASSWQCFLQLTYNNFLVLLHRPPPRQNPHQPVLDAASDLNICGDAVVVITSVFESMRTKRSMGDLAIPGMYTLFTALVHVSSELKSTNPLVAAKSMRMLDSLLLSLRELSHHWLFARSLLRLFEERAIWDTQQDHHDRRLQEAPAADLGHRPIDGPHAEAPEFSLRPNPLTMSSVNILNPAESPNNSTFTSSSIISGQGSIYAGHLDRGINTGHDAEAGSRDMLQGQSTYSESFNDGGLTMSSDALEMMPFPLALDFLLAGMGNEYECM